MNFVKNLIKYINHLRKHINISHLKVKNLNVFNSYFGIKSTLNSHIKTHNREKCFIVLLLDEKKIFC